MGIRGLFHCCLNPLQEKGGGLVFERENETWVCKLQFIGFEIVSNLASSNNIIIIVNVKLPNNHKDIKEKRSM